MKTAVNLSTKTIGFWKRTALEEGFLKREGSGAMRGTTRASVLLALLAAAVCVAAQQARIVGGQEVVPGQTPDVTWSLALNIDNRLLCGGTCATLRCG